MRLGLIHPFNFEGAPPLGLASIATYLREYAGFSDTRIIDAAFEDPLEVVRRWKPDVVGISAMTGTYGDSIRTARRIKEMLDIPVLVGGVHISTLPTSLSDVFELGVVGEGEQTMLELVQLYLKEGGFPKGSLMDVPGLVFRKDGSIVSTGARKLIAPLDNIPIPDRGFINKEYRKPRLAFWGGEYYLKMDFIMTARGCPYKCTFCSTSKFWQTFRLHSPKRVFDEIKMLVDDYGIDFIVIMDDLFTYNKGRIKEIKRLLEEEGLLDRIKVSCNARVNIIDDELCGLLKGLKVNNINFGFESGSDRILRSLKKEGVTVERTKNAVRTCIKHNLHVGGSFILGSPGEAIEDMEKTVDLMGWMAREGVNGVEVFAMTPYPGTEIWEIAKERGKVSDDMDWEDEGNPIQDRFLRYSVHKNPPLLDDSIDKKEFKRVWEKAKAEMDKMKSARRRLSHLKMRLRYEPVKTLKYVLYDPEKAVSFVRKVFSLLADRILGR